MIGKINVQGLTQPLQQNAGQTGPTPAQDLLGAHAIVHANVSAFGKPLRFGIESDASGRAHVALSPSFSDRLRFPRRGTQASKPVRPTAFSTLARQDTLAPRLARQAAGQAEVGAFNHAGAFRDMGGEPARSAAVRDSAFAPPTLRSLHDAMRNRWMNAMLHSSGT